MVTKRIFIVFVLPIIFSLIFGSAVMADILQKPDRELNMWPMSTAGESSHNDSSYSAQLEIINLFKQYSTSEPIEIQVSVNDLSFNCGDLYITIYSLKTNDVVTQEGFFEQCFESNNPFIPTSAKFSKFIDTPGSYKMVIDMISKELSNASTSETFTVK